MRPKREAIRRNEYAYFVSTQTEGRKLFFRHERWAQLIKATIARYAESAFILHAFAIMPDHLHLLITPTETVEKAVQMVKGGFSFTAKREFSWEGQIWQQGFTDHRIRDEEDWNRHLEYIRLNPVRARLVEESELYPYMGFPNEDFPQGLKPQHSLAEDNVRAKARTLQPGLKSGDEADVRTEARTLKDSLKPGGWGWMLLIALACAMACGAAHAQQMDKDGPIRLTHVEGLVVNTRGTPAANVEVTLSQDDKVRMSTHTDQSGKFRFDHAEGAYMFRVARTLNAPAAHTIVVRAEIATYIERKKLYVVLGPGACADECSLVVTSKEEFEHAIRKNGGR